MEQDSVIEMQFGLRLIVLLSIMLENIFVIPMAIIPAGRGSVGGPNKAGRLVCGAIGFGYSSTGLPSRIKKAWLEVSIVPGVPRHVPSSQRRVNHEKTCPILDYRRAHPSPLVIASRMQQLLGWIGRKTKSIWGTGWKGRRCHHLNRGNFISVAYQKQAHWVWECLQLHPGQTGHRAGGVGPAASSLRHRITS
jgi:hypothetical protein